MTDSPKIWIAEFFSNVFLIHKGLGYVGSDDLKVRIANSKKYLEWKRLVGDEIPTKLYFDLYDLPESKKTIRTIQSTGQFVFVSARFADLLKEFDLGATQLIELPIYEFDRETKRPETLFLLNICETKDTFVPEESQDVELVGALWSSGNVKNLAVKASSANGVDLWADPKIRRVAFCSDRLTKAIRKGKFGRVPLHPAKVV